jgi:hypothetical protein
VIAAAALCPWPPVLAAELTGPDPVIDRLRDACARAVRRLVQVSPELIAVIGPARQTRAWDPDSRLDLSVFAPARSRAGDPALPPSLGLGVLLLEAAGYTGRRVLQAVAEEEPPDACAELGASIGRSGVRAGLLVMGDGSARRSERAPGHLDARAAAFDASTERAFRSADFDALLAISPGLARELMATGRPAWQVLAGALRGAELTSDVLYSDDPFGVAYLVAVLESRPVLSGLGYGLRLRQLAASLCDASQSASAETFGGLRTGWPARRGSAPGAVRPRAPGPARQRGTGGPARARRRCPAYG